MADAGFSKGATPRFQGSSPGEDVERAGEKKTLLEKPSDGPHDAITAYFGVPVTVVAGLAYCAASASMFLLNKAQLSSFGFSSPTALLIFQCAVCVVLVKLAQGLGIIQLEPFNWAIVKIWFPVNMLFVGMIWTSFVALKALGVPMATVLKTAFGNLFVIVGDYALFGKTYGVGVWVSLVLLVISAICGGITDLAFDAYGYAWQIVNCLFTAAYSVFLRQVMDKVTALTVKRTKLDEFSMVFYNNLLSLPLLCGLLLVTNEHSFWREPALSNPNFIIAVSISGVLSFAISFASLWFLSTTTPTKYSLVGSINKVPVAILGLILFNTPWNWENVASIFIGLVAGVIFVAAKGR